MHRNAEGFISLLEWTLSEVNNENIPSRLLEIIREVNQKLFLQLPTEGVLNRAKNQINQEFKKSNISVNEILYNYKDCYFEYTALIDNKDSYTVRDYGTLVDLKSGLPSRKLEISLPIS